MILLSGICPRHVKPKTSSEDKIMLNMDNEDRKYLRAIEKARPGIEVFARMVQILKNEQRKVNELLTLVDTTLLESCKAV
jgi:hypothetical protein